MHELTSPDEDLMRFELLLPYYITGALSENDRAFVKFHIDSNTQAKCAYLFARRLKDIVQSTGTQRDVEVALSEFLSAFDEANPRSLWQRFRTFVGVRGFLLVMLLASVFAIGFIALYGSGKLSLLDTTLNATTSSAHLSITIKNSIESSALILIIERVGGRVVHSVTSGELETLFINLTDKTKIQLLIDTLLDTGLVEAAAILL